MEDVYLRMHFYPNSVVYLVNVDDVRELVLNDRDAIIGGSVNII